MNQYLQAFREVIESTEQLLDAQYYSLESVEIRQSASILQESTSSCIVELKLSARRLNETLRLCFENLALAEEVWKSKQRISEASSLEIWQHIGDISGCQVRIQSMITVCKISAIEKLLEAWDKRSEELLKKYFFNLKGKMKDRIGWDDKKGFLIDVTPMLLAQSNETNQIIREGLISLFRDLGTINSVTLDACLKLLDVETAQKKEFKLRKILKNEDLKFKDPKSSFDDIHFIELHELFNQTIKDAGNRWGDIEWKYIAQYKDEISNLIRQRVTTVFDDRARVIEECLEQMLRFYNDILELQQRYQQETPEQRLTEKDWIDQQRQEFEKVQADIDVVLG